ncbi:MAG: protein translocase subunit SecD [Clostridiales bacterium]|nr:protein translocase subunit SecD [Clostridiales bacterium]
MNISSEAKVILILILIAGAIYLSLTPLLGVNGLNLGLDLQGGAQVVFQATPEDGKGVITRENMVQLIEVMDRRVNELGVSEPVIQIEGNDRLIVELAGVDNPDKAIEIIGQTAHLEFRDPNGGVILTGADLVDAKALIVNSPNAMERNIVELTFSNEGKELFKVATATFIGQSIGIYLDDILLTNPTVKSVIPNGVASISGGYENFDTANEHAILLRSGSLPVKTKVLSKHTVGPTLGQDSLAKSLQAALLGLIILAAFMMLYYRLPGIWACISLLAYALILVWVLYLLRATLTLTSIAGFILSVGMAVDANIIIYERIKEELYSGKSLSASIEAGFKRAFTTVLDSNLTTLIAAVVLFYLGSGTIKGFALTLSIGLIASLFTAVTLTRFMLRWTSDINFLAKKSFYGMGKKQRVFHFDFLRKKKVFYAISLLIIIPGMVVLATRGLNLGIDFTGGSIALIEYEQPIDLAEVRNTVSSFVVQTPTVQQSENNQFLIRTEQLESEQNSAMLDALGELGGEANKMQISRNDLIGPAIGAELLKNAQWALIVAIILMLLYITVRFQLNFALTSILGLLHDSLVMLSVFAIFQIEVDSAFIAAILTIIGYSINNTIVIFDRIRENVRHQERLTVKDLINNSINQTFTRSVNTVVAVLFLLLSMLFVGGETTKVFMLALAVGMVAGFYSSLCVVGNLLDNISSKSGLSVGKSKAAVRVRTSEAAK